MKPIPSHELVGARVVGELPSTDMVDLWVRISLLLHLFGHSVQWVAPSLAHTLEELQRTEDRSRFLQA